MEEYKTIYFKFGALIECEHVAIDNVYSIDIHIDDDYFNMDLNGIDGFVLGTIVQCGKNDIIEEINAIKYNEECDIDDSGDCVIIKNGKVIYKEVVNHES